MSGDIRCLFCNAPGGFSTSPTHRPSNDWEVIEVYHYGEKKIIHICPHCIKKSEALRGIVKSVDKPDALDVLVNLILLDMEQKTKATVF